MSLSRPPHEPGGSPQPPTRRGSYGGAGSQDADYSGPDDKSLVPGLPDEPAGGLKQGEGYSEPGYAGPAYDEQGYAGPAYDEQGYAGPAYDEQGYDEHGYANPGYADPGYAETTPPSRRGFGRLARVLGRGRRGGVGYAEPGYDQPSGEWPGYDQPSGEWPGYDQPSGEWPGYDQPSGEWPGYDQPSGEWPGYDQPSGEPRGGGGRPVRRILLAAAATLLLIIVIAVIGTRLIRGNPAAASREASAAPSPTRSTMTAPASQATGPQAVTLADAHQILSSYLAANNTANRLRSSSALAAIEGASSYSMDAGNYRWTQVTDPENLNYRPVTLADPDYYLPQQPGYPLWFAVRGTWVAGGTSTQVWSSAYLVFAQASPGARWLEIFEPNIIPGGPSIRIATDPSGNAEQADATGLSVPPAGIQDLTARFLDGARTGLAWPGGPGYLADLAAQAFWQARLPARSTDSDRHSPSAGQVFGLRTANGGALLFFGLKATVTVADGPVAVAETHYADQLAVYDPPGTGSGSPEVVADASGVTSGG